MIKFNFSSTNGLADKGGELKQNAFGSCAVVPVGAVSSFSDRFDAQWTGYNYLSNYTTITDVANTANTLRNEVNTLLTDYTTTVNLADAVSANMHAYVDATYGSVVTKDSAASMYTLQVSADSNVDDTVPAAIAGFTIGALSNSTTNSSYFNVVADSFMVYGMVDGVLDTQKTALGVPIPAFSITNDGTNTNINFNGKVVFENLLGGETVLEELADIASDSMLSPGEKVTAVRLLTDVDNDYIIKISEATISGLSTSYLTSYKSALHSYIDPLLIDVTVSSAVDRATWNTNWSNYINESLSIDKLVKDGIRTTSQENLDALADIAADGILSQGEKRDIIREVEAIDLNKIDLDAKASAVGVSSTTYDNYVTTLKNYLGTLSTPVAWNSLAGDTTVNSTTWMTNFRNVYSEKLKLEQAITSKIQNNVDLINSDLAITGEEKRALATLLGSITNEYAPLVDRANNIRLNEVQSGGDGTLLTVTHILDYQNTYSNLVSVIGSMGVTWSGTSSVYATTSTYITQSTRDLYDTRVLAYVKYKALLEEAIANKLKNITDNLATTFGTSSSGYTEIDGSTVTTGKLKNASGTSYLDLDNGAFQLGADKLSFDGTNLTMQGDITAGNISGVAITGSSGHFTASQSVDNLNVALVGQSTYSIGVYASSINNFGIKAVSTLSNGVEASSSNGSGVSAYSTNGNGVSSFSYSAKGVSGGSTNSYGVMGTSYYSYGMYASSTQSHGIYATGSLYGVYTPNAILAVGYIRSEAAGLFNQSSIDTYGVDAITGNSNGAGVYGHSSVAAGVYGNGSRGVVAAGQSGNYDFYAQGAGVNYGSFTGAHDAFINLTETYILGDIVAMDETLFKGTLSNTSGRVTVTNSINNKAVFGVVAAIGMDKNDVVASVSQVDYQTIIADMDKVAINSLGEGQINVCEIGGDIDNGDYITSSIVPGKGMKQADDLQHNYTVAKATELVVWANEADGTDGVYLSVGSDGISYKTKMIACTYHSG